MGSGEVEGLVEGVVDGFEEGLVDGSVEGEAVALGLVEGLELGDEEAAVLAAVEGEAVALGSATVMVVFVISFKALLSLPVVRTSVASVSERVVEPTALDLTLKVITLPWPVRPELAATATPYVNLILPLVAVAATNSVGKPSALRKLLGVRTAGS